MKRYLGLTPVKELANITFPAGITIDVVEQEMLRQALVACAGNKVHASTRMGYKSNRTIYNRLADYARRAKEK